MVIDARGAADVKQQPNNSPEATPISPTTTPVAVEPHSARSSQISRLGHGQVSYRPDSADIRLGIQGQAANREFTARGIGGRESGSATAAGIWGGAGHAGRGRTGEQHADPPHKQKWAKPGGERHGAFIGFLTAGMFRRAAISPRIPLN